MPSSRTAHDLPEAAVLEIINLARGSRRLPGTNRFAEVCRGWRDVDSTSTDSELQLHVEQMRRGPSDFKKTKKWFILYGQNVSSLGLASKLHLTWFLLASSNMCSNLRQLTLCGINSLTDLLATNVQLPLLQHLTAFLDQFEAWPKGSDQLLLAHSSEGCRGVYPLQQACPGLVELQLTFDVDGDADDPRTFNSLEELLPRLLPPTLQQLGLRWSPEEGECSMAPAAVTHITALRHLACWWIDVSPEVPLALPEGCTLRLLECSTWESEQFRDRLTALGADHDVEDANAIANLTQLTSLAWLLFDYNDGDGWCLSGLTALQQLQLHAYDDGAEVVVECLQHVTGLASLSHLEVRTTWCERHELLAAVSRLTQLSSLCLTPGLTSIERGPGGLPLGPAAAPQAAGGGAMTALQGLVGLRQLELGIGHLLEHPTGWLAHLTQLTLLAVDCVELEEQLLPLHEGQPEEQQQEQVLAGCVAALGPRLHLVSFARLVQVVLYVRSATVYAVAPSMLPGVPTVVQAPRLSWQWRGEPSCFRPMAPFLKLPGVWEMLE